MDYKTIMAVYLTISTACVIVCIAATLRVYREHIRQARASAAEIEHLKAEVRACRNLLRRR